MIWTRNVDRHPESLAAGGGGRRVWGEATGASSSTRRLSGVEGGQVVPGNTIAPQRTEDCWNVVRYVLPCTTNAQNLARKTDKVPPPVLAFFCPGDYVWGIMCWSCLVRHAWLHTIRWSSYILTCFCGIITSCWRHSEWPVWLMCPRVIIARLLLLVALRLSDRFMYAIHTSLFASFQSHAF